MSRCIIIGCNNNQKITNKQKKYVSYHHFPKDSQRRNVWINSIRLPFNFNADTAYVCSEHFISDDFKNNSLKEELLNIKVQRQLKKTAIPSINIPYISKKEGFTNEANNSNTYLKYINQSGGQKNCVVPFCDNSTVNCGSNEPNSNSEIVFHKFPSDQVVLEKWLKFCNIYKSIPNEYQNDHICSVHFNKDNYTNEKSLHPIVALKKDAVPTLNCRIKIVDLKSIEDDSSKKEHTHFVDNLLEHYEEQNEKEAVFFFSPNINPNAKFDDKLKLLKSEENSITYRPSKKMKTFTTPKLSPESSESLFVEKLNQTIQVRYVNDGLMLHELPYTAHNVLSSHLEKTVTDEKKKIIIVTREEANIINLTLNKEEDKGNNTEVIEVTDLKETEDTLQHTKSVPKKYLTNNVYDSDEGHIQQLLKDNASLFTSLNKTKVSSRINKRYQSKFISCNECQNKSFKINKLLREKTEILKGINKNSSWKNPDKIKTLTRMTGVLSLLLMQRVGKKDGKKSSSISVNLVQDSIERINHGWSMQDMSDTLCQALSINAYDEFAREYKLMNEI